MSGLHGRPTAAELIEAVREFLDDPALAESAPHPFVLRVARNALRMVERELSADPILPAGERLGFGGDADFAVLIRGGSVPDAQRATVRAELLRDVEARLAVTNPVYVDQYVPDTFEGD